MLEVLSDFTTWVAGRTLGKLLLLAVVALPIAAVIGYVGLSKRRRND